MAAAALVAMLVSVGVTACASVSHDHGVVIRNAGSHAIYNVSMYYGGHLLARRPVQKMVPGAEDQIGFNVPVQQSLRVTWSNDPAGSLLHDVTVPLAGKLSIFRLSRWFVMIEDDHLEVIREDETGPVNPHTYLIPRRMVKVFP